MATIYPKITIRHGGTIPSSTSTNSLASGELFFHYNSDTNHTLFIGYNNLRISLGPTSGKVWGKTLSVSPNNNIVGDMTDVGNILFQNGTSSIGAPTNSGQRPNNIYLNSTVYVSSANGKSWGDRFKNTFGSDWSAMQPGQILVNRAFSESNNPEVRFYNMVDDNIATWVVGVDHADTRKFVIKNETIASLSVAIEHPLTAVSFIKKGVANGNQYVLLADGSHKKIDELSGGGAGSLSGGTFTLSTGSTTVLKDSTGTAITNLKLPATMPSTWQTNTCECKKPVITYVDVSTSEYTITVPSDTTVEHFYFIHNKTNSDITIKYISFSSSTNTDYKKFIVPGYQIGEISMMYISDIVTGTTASSVKNKWVSRCALTEQ